MSIKPQWIEPPRFAGWRWLWHDLFGHPWEKIAHRVTMLMIGDGHATVTPCSCGAKLHFNGHVRRHIVRRRGNY